MSTGGELKKSARLRSRGAGALFPGFAPPDAKGGLLKRTRVSGSVPSARELLEGVVERLTLIEATVRRIELRLAGHGPREDADRTILLTLAAVCGDAASFTSAEVMAHADVHETLAAALLAADIESPSQLGWLLRRLELLAEPIDGWRLARVGTSRAGIRWRLRVSSPISAPRDDEPS
jgi:hypothetical protein